MTLLLVRISGTAEAPRDSESVPASVAMTGSGQLVVAGSHPSPRMDTTEMGKCYRRGWAFLFCFCESCLSGSPLGTYGVDDSCVEEGMVWGCRCGRLVEACRGGWTLRKPVGICVSLMG